MAEPLFETPYDPERFFDEMFEAPGVVRPHYRALLWISLDPTHDTAQGPQHVRVGVGRDYADVPPTRGVFKGNGSEALAVTVRLESL